MILTGLVRLGRDGELRYTANQTPVCQLAFVYNYGKKGQDGKKPSQWVDAALWGKQAEALAQYMTKGTQLNVVLSDVHVDTYEGKNGFGAKLVARVVEIEFAGGSQAKPQAPALSGGDDFFDDDIPF